jgi:hypothetical protein
MQMLLFGYAINLTCATSRRGGRRSGTIVAPSLPLRRGLVGSAQRPFGICATMSAGESASES